VPLSIRQKGDSRGAFERSFASDPFLGSLNPPALRKRNGRAA